MGYSRHNNYISIDFLKRGYNMKKLGFRIERKNTEVYPTIDSAKCNIYISYVNKCKNKVYAIEDKKKFLIHITALLNSLNQPVCQKKAISHLQKENLFSLRNNKDFKPI